MFKKELKNYLTNFDNDVEAVERLAEFAKDAIRFVIYRGLYAEFMKYCADQAAKRAIDQKEKL